MLLHIVHKPYLSQRRLSFCRRLSMSDFAGDKGSAPVESNPMDLDHKAPQYVAVNLTAKRREELSEAFLELKDLQEQCDLLESQHMARIDRIQASFEHNVQPLYSERSSVLAVENEKGFSNFWLTAMKEFCKMLSSRMGVKVEFTDQDEAAFEYLKDIKYTPLNDEPKGWKLEFFFDSKSNPYFSNPVLTTEAHYTRFRGRKIYKELKGTEIKWHSGKCLTRKPLKSMNKRYLVHNSSFFNLFGCNELYDTHDEFHAAQTEIQRRHIKICRCFIKILIPHPVRFYNRRHKFGAWDVKSPEDDSTLNQMSTDDHDPKCVAGLDVKELRMIEWNIEKLEAIMLAAKEAAQGVYQGWVQPLYDRRSALIADILVGESAPIAFPNFADPIMLAFWMNALRGEETLSEMISGCDALVLTFLKDIRFSKLDDCKGWKLEFFFAPNIFFQNCVLTKVIKSLPSNGACKTFNSTGTEIKWHPDNLFDVDDGESFLNLFSGCEDDGYSEEDLKRDLNICNIIRRRIIPHAVSFYFDNL